MYIGLLRDALIGWLLLWPQVDWDRRNLLLHEITKGLGPLCLALISTEVCLGSILLTRIVIYVEQGLSHGRLWQICDVGGTVVHPGHYVDKHVRFYFLGTRYRNDGLPRLDKTF